MLFSMLGGMVYENNKACAERRAKYCSPSTFKITDIKLVKKWFSGRTIQQKGRYNVLSRYMVSGQNARKRAWTKCQGQNARK